MRGRQDGAQLLILQASALPKQVEVRTSQGASGEGRGSRQPAPSLLLVVPKPAFVFLTTISRFLSAAPVQLWKQFRSSAQQLSPVPVQSRALDAIGFIWD